MSAGKPSGASRRRPAAARGGRRCSAAHAALRPDRQQADGPGRTGRPPSRRTAGTARSPGGARGHPDGLDLADRDRGDQRAADRADAAEHDHDQGEQQDEVRGARPGPDDRGAERAGEPGECAARGEHAGAHHERVDAQRGDHLAVVDGGPHQAADPGAGDDDVQRDRDQRGDADEGQAVAGVGVADESTGRSRAAGTVTGSSSGPKSPTSRSPTTSATPKVSSAWAR